MVQEMVGWLEEEQINESPSELQLTQTTAPPPISPRGSRSKKRKKKTKTSQPFRPARPSVPSPPPHPQRAMISECYNKLQCCLATGWQITIGAVHGVDLTVFMGVSSYVCICVHMRAKRKCVCVCVSIMSDVNVCVDVSPEPSFAATSRQ